MVQFLAKMQVERCTVGKLAKKRGKKFIENLCQVEFNQISLTRLELPDFVAWTCTFIVRNGENASLMI